MSLFFYSFPKTLGTIFLKNFSCELAGEFNHFLLVEVNHINDVELLVQKVFLTAPS